MKCRLTTQEKLKDLRDAKGLTQTEVGEATGLGKSTISNYESDEWKELQLYALKELADFYEVPLAYLIGLTDNLTESETDISMLHIDDETVQILKSEKYNNRLICEMIKHPAFGNLISDLEIYVDNLAGSYIHFLNSYIEMLRDKIKEANAPEDDINLKTTYKSTVDDDEYFGDLLVSDLKKIAKELREAHKKDWDTGDENQLADKYIANIKEMMEASQNGDADTLDSTNTDATVSNTAEETPDEEMTYIDKATVVKWSHMLDLNLTKLTPTEVNELMRLVKKSCKHPLFKNPPKGRGKKK